MRNDHGYPDMEEEEYRQREERRERDFRRALILFVAVNFAFWIPVLIGLASCF